MQKLIVLLGLALLVSGCAGVATMPFSSPSSLMTTPSAATLEIHSQTDIKLEGANFVVVKTNVVGQSKGFALLGVITIVPAKFTKAMNRLYGQSDMQSGRAQTLANLIMEKSSTYLILFSIPRVAVRADVVEFISETPVLLPQPLLPAPSPSPSPPENKTSANKSSAVYRQ